MFNEQTSNKPLILIVDDDVFMRGMLYNMLEEQGFQVLQAEDGRKALAIFQEKLPEIVLMDAAMPNMDGFTACAELKKLEAGIETPVIMITSLDDTESVDKAFTAGAIEYITKPVHWSVLRHRVQVILEARRATTQVKRSESRFRGLFEQAAMGIGLLDLNGACLFANPALEQLLETTTEQLQGKLLNRYFHPSDTVIEREFHQQLVNRQINFYQMEKYFFRKENSISWGRLTTSLVRNEKEEPQFFVQMIEDITERKKSQIRQRIAARVFESTADGILITNADGKIIDVNQAFLLMTGYGYEEILDQNPRFLKSDKHEPLFFENMWAQASDTGRWRGQVWNKHRSGKTFSCWMSLSAVRGEHNEITHFVAVYSNINHSDDEQKVRVLSHYDPLTDLPNRLLFHEHLTRACRQEEKIALLYIDLDNFKRINETLGYDTGDECLRLIAGRLRQCLREGDYIARLENDEFAILMTPITQNYDVRLMADKIFARLSEPFLLEGRAIKIDANIGICFYPSPTLTRDEPNSIETLIQHADVAMFLAKEIGKNTYYIQSEKDVSII